MKGKARGFLWMRHEMRREHARQWAAKRRKMWFFIGLAVGAVFVGIITRLLIAA